ncbi:MAG: class D sortase, partial [Clostridia bacterium]|nr:class D sortase [Clostridia bacterium]
PKKTKFNKDEKEEKINSFRYSTIYINSVSLIISILIFLSINFISNNFNQLFQKNNLKINFEVEEINQNKDSEENIKININDNLQKKDDYEEKKEDIKSWYLEIPTINLKVEIEEGTTKEVLDKYIGHFEETKKEEGNIGLAAHNRGYEKNYFENLKKLKEGDEIFYNHNNYTKKYKVCSIRIIKDTDWTFLENTEDNRITLITCVENEPEYRRCVQGREIK